MLPLLAAGLVGLGTGIVQSLVQNKMNRDNQDAQNQYNSPQAQMSRFTAAGLNPNLIYGQGNAGNQSQPVQFEAPDMSIAKLAEYVAVRNGLKQGVLLDQQARKMEEDIRLTSNKAQNESMKTMLASLYGERLQAEQPYFSRNAANSAEMMNARLILAMKEMGLKDATLSNLGLDNQIKHQILSERSFYNQQLHRTGVGKNQSFGSGLFQLLLNGSSNPGSWINKFR